MIKPTIFDLSNNEDSLALESLRKSGAVVTTIDHYIEQVRELYGIDNPDKIFTPDYAQTLDAYISSLGDTRSHGRWVYFPWSATVVHLLEPETFFKVRTARNQLLISPSEQEKYYNAVIAIAGLSVGNSVALSIVLQGGARRIKLADHDTLDLSNLNRIRAGVTGLGVAKVEVTARQIYELNPYAEVELFPEGLNEDTLPGFFDGTTIVIDEIDNLAMKWTLREWAQKFKLPVLMAADNDRMGVIDVERYDLDPNLEFFHGRLGAMTKEDLLKLDKRSTGRTIAQLVGIENHTSRMLESLMAMGKSIASWPQLGGTALMNGAFLAHAALRITNGQPVITDRVLVSIDATMDGDYLNPEVTAKRDGAIAQFKQILGL